MAILRVPGIETMNGFWVLSHASAILGRRCVGLFCKSFEQINDPHIPHGWPFAHLQS
jgi:hypothetical protein